MAITPTPDAAPPGVSFGSSTVLIRLGAVLFVFLALGHMSAYPWASTRGGQGALVSSMKAIAFEFMGERSTYWNLYFGWGLLVGLLLLTLAAILWLVSDLASLAPKRIGVLTGLVCGVAAIGACLSFRYFYLPPSICFVAVSLVLLTVSVRLFRAPSGVGAADPSGC